MVTCYDYAFARLAARSHIDAILVGDSLGMVVHGFSSTLPVTLAMMSAHTAAVVRGAPKKFVIADMPFLTFRKGIGTAMDAAGELMTAGAGAVKLEGVAGHEDVIERLVGSGIPVMGHIGMQPQSVNAYGGFRVQGRDEDVARNLVEQATKLQQSGAFAVVVECIPSAVAARIREAIDIPTIGIGAGACCDGQVLVLHDLLGFNIDFRPRFVREFLHGAADVVDALNEYDEAVKAGGFPDKEESFS